MTQRRSEEPGSPETATFWEAARSGKLLIKSCKNCDRAHYYPRARCPHCFSEHTEWREAQGAAHIYAFSIMRRGQDAPYAVAYVTLEEGPSMLTRLVDCDVEALAIGQRVELKFTAAEDGRLLPMFTCLGDDYGRSA